MAFNLPMVQHAATAILNLLVAGAVGAAATRLWTARLASPWTQMRDNRARLAGIAAIAGAIVASVSVLWLEAAAMAEVPVAQAAKETWTMLTATHLGAAWQVGVAALVVSLVAMALATSGRAKARWVNVSLAGTAVFLYSRSMVSHAAGRGDFSVMMLVDWLHLMLICLWVGEVFIAGLVVLATPPGQAQADRADCARYVESLSTSATFALVGIFATGGANAWFNLGRPSALISTEYGSTLMIKVALVLAAAALGGINRFVVMPRLIEALHTGDSASLKQARRFALVLRVEAIVLFAVLVVAAVLSATSPPTAG